MSDHVARLSEALAADPLSDDEVTLLLDLARDVAHGTERKVAPLSTFLAGMYVGRQLDAGADRLTILREAADRLQRALDGSDDG